MLAGYNLVPMTILVSNPRAFIDIESTECSHVARDHHIAYGTCVERSEGITKVVRVCQKCALEWSDRVHRDTVTCDYCGHTLSKDRALLWMPKSAHPERGDEPQVVCSSCVLGSWDFKQDVKADEVMFRNSKGGCRGSDKS